MDIERVRKELQESALREFPNPERIGCPDPETLGGMSRRIIQMTQDQLHHVAHCSPCFQTFLAIREEVRLVAADEADREEMRSIREQLAELAPPTSD